MIENKNMPEIINIRRLDNSEKRATKETTINRVKELIAINFGNTQVIAVGIFMKKYQ